MEYATNVWTELADLGDGVRGTRLERIRGELLASAVWELEPGANVDYHFHHGAQELILVLRGRVTLRTKDGERELAEGDVVAFPRGLEGAHGTANGTDEPARYLMVAAHDTPEVIEYPTRARSPSGRERPRRTASRSSCASGATTRWTPDPPVRAVSHGEPATVPV